MSDEWPELRRADLRLSFRHPAMTPGGQLVEIAEEFPGDAHRVHVTAPVPGEIYLELFRMPGLSAADEYTRHRSYLEGRFGPGSVGEPVESDLAGRPARSYVFGSDDLRREARSLEVDEDLYRVIIDPRIPLNHEIVATMRVDD
ncbi:MAG TPA: hypothetical protein VFV56_00010 [Gaiellaceae bacterium]|nr:hypothetical protein [Gaiellaceae bacterium]